MLLLLYSHLTSLAGIPFCAALFKHCAQAGRACSDAEKLETRGRGGGAVSWLSCLSAVLQQSRNYIPLSSAPCGDDLL